MLQTILNKISWMQWTLPSVIFIGGIFLSIAIIGIVESFIPVYEKKKGFLPIPTTPGDKLFISILYILGLFLFWMAIFKANLLWLYIILAIGGVIMIAWKG